MEWPDYMLPWQQQPEGPSLIGNTLLRNLKKEEKKIYEKKVKKNSKKYIGFICIFMDGWIDGWMA